jgi:hypothetical protein
LNITLATPPLPLVSSHLIESSLARLEVLAVDTCTLLPVKVDVQAGVAESFKLRYVEWEDACRRLSQDVKAGVADIEG